MQARAVGWALNYKGVIGGKGNVTQVAFGGNQNQFNLQKELIVYYETFRETVAGARK
jgi:hypothetical protein